MALPSAVRPKEIEEELLKILELRKQERERLEEVVHTSETFQCAISDWYSKLPQCKKAELTPKALKRKALDVCQTYDLVYERLPLNWLERLQKECNLKLHKKQKKLKESQSKPKCRKGRGEGEASTALPSTVTSVSSRIHTRGKKFVDLSNNPPPPFWLAAYAQGVTLPRVLSVYSAEDVNIIYYDYAPKFKDCFEREMKLTPQPRISCTALE